MRILAQTRRLSPALLQQLATMAEGASQLIVDLLRARGIDPQRLPIVVRLFGPGEDEARRIAATLPGLHYMPPDSPIDAAVQRIVELTQ